MITFQVHLSQYGADWRTLTPRLEQAIAYSLNNAGRRVFTQVRRGLFAKLGPKRYSSITRRTYNMPAHVGALAFTIVARGRPMPITEFPVKRTAAGIQASPWATSRIFKRSFQQKTPGGGFIPGTFWARIEEGREPIRRLYGPNVAKELLGMTRGDETIPDLFFAAASVEVPRAVLQSVEAALRRQAPTVRRLS